MSLTGTFNTRAGSGTVEINESSLPTSNDLQLTDVSKLEIDYDLKDESEEANNVFFSPSEFTVEFFDTVGDYSLFNLLDGILSTTEIELNLDFTTDGGNSFVMPFVFTKNDASYDREKRTVEIEAVLDLDSDITVSEVVNYESEDHVATDRNGNSITAYDFIDNYFDMYADGVNINRTYGFSDPNPFNDGQDSFVVNDRSVLTGEPDPKASSILFRIGAMDGAFVGSLMGYNFIINRLDTTDKIQISESEVDSLEVNFGLENYYRLEASFADHFGWNGNEDGYFDDNTESWLADVRTDGLNPEGTKRLRVHFANRGVLKLMEWSTSQEEFSYYQNNVLRVQILDARENENLIRFRSDQLEDLRPVEGDRIFFGEPQADTTAQITYEDRVYEVVSTDSNDDEMVISPPLHRDFSKREEDGVTEYATINVVSPQLVKDPSIISNSLQCYGKAYGADGSREIQLTLWDLDRMNPQDAIELDSSFPEAVRNKIFRPSKLTYNLMNDKIKVEAYEIENV